MMQNKKMIGLLMVLLVAVWGAIAYQIIEALGDEEVRSETSSAELRPMKKNQARYTYLADVRDPFFHNFSLSGDSVRRSGLLSKGLLRQPPAMELSGIVINNKRKTALLKMKDGQTYFLGEGDTLAGIRILKIQSRSVTYSFAKQKHEWVLQ